MIKIKVIENNLVDAIHMRQLTSPAPKYITMLRMVDSFLLDNILGKAMKVETQEQAVESRYHCDQTGIPQLKQPSEKDNPNHTNCNRNYLCSNARTTSFDRLCLQACRLWLFKEILSIFKRHCLFS